MERWLLLVKNEYFIEFAILLGLVCIAIIGFYVGRKILLPIIQQFFKRTKITWDDILTDYRFFRRLMLLIPAMIFHYGLPFVPHFYDFLSKTIQIYVYFVIIAVLNSFLDTVVAIYSTRSFSHKWPLKGWGQLLKMFVTILGIIFIIALILDKSPWGFVSSIGAMTAILLLIFKDTLLSFVASIQIASYKLIRVGDWIEMPSFGVDGDVIDISLHTIKVQNFDKTVVSVPTHKFLENSFKNWRGMYEANGRRIKRSILIDQTSVAFLDQDVLNKMKNVDLLKGYLNKKIDEITEDNQRHAYASDNPLNGRRLTNLGTFRAYIIEYLKRNPHIRKDLTLIVRHLQPEANRGLPLEIYCFADDIRWGHYESIQADIFDHILAAMPLFGLRAYQRDALVDNRGKCELMGEGS